jgi:serine/threonine-protein kinase
MKKTVAFKVLHPEIAAIGDVAARFEREAVAAGRIDHPNVARAMDFGALPDGSFYLVIEYVAGESLAELIKRGPLAPASASNRGQIAAAIHAAHRWERASRSKPANDAADRDSAGSCVGADLAWPSFTRRARSAITRHGESSEPQYMVRQLGWRWIIAWI